MNKLGMVAGLAATVVAMTLTVTGPASAGGSGGLRDYCSDTESAHDDGYTVLFVPPGGFPFDGTSGRDLIIGTQGDDDINSKNDDDVVCGFSGADDIDGGRDDDSIFAMAGDDDADGESGDDWVDGGNGDDEVRGSDGNDHLVGGDGADDCHGGLGSNTFDPSC
jgi:Ca2+-binding RTX toxin-like protein